MRMPFWTLAELCRLLVMSVLGLITLEAWSGSGIEVSAYALTIYL